MNFDEILRKLWDSKPNSIFFNTFQGLVQSKNENFFTYYNPDLIKHKRPTSKLEPEKKVGVQ